MLTRLAGIGGKSTFLTIIDVMLVAVLLYRIIRLFAGTRAVAVINGLMTLIIASLASRYLGLTTLDWLLQKAMTAVLIALPIVFQPELRRGLERIGAHRAISRVLPWVAPPEEKVPAEHIAEAARLLSEQGVGGLIVIRSEMSLGDIIESGVAMDATLSTALLCQIFVPNSPLHDGAVIVSGERIVSAACQLPLSNDGAIDKELGMRHRAALGMVEVSDAIVVVISEETGHVSVARAGQLKTLHEPSALLDELGGSGRPPKERRLWSMWNLTGGGRR